MRERNINPDLIQYRLEKEEKSREKIKEYFMTEQISSEVAAYTLRLLGFTVMRGKEILKQWACEKASA